MGNTVIHLSVKMQTQRGPPFTVLTDVWSVQLDPQVDTQPLKWAISSAKGLRVWRKGSDAEQRTAGTTFLPGAWFTDL